MLSGQAVLASVGLLILFLALLVRSVIMRSQSYFRDGARLAIMVTLHDYRGEYFDIGVASLVPLHPRYLMIRCFCNESGSGAFSAFSANFDRWKSRQGGSLRVSCQLLRLLMKDLHRLRVL